MTDTVLLTGITGFLGSHIALELLNSGYNVRGSLRNPARGDTIRAALAAAGADTGGLEFVTLDLTRDDGWTEAAAGTRFVLHVASPFVTTMPKDPQVLIGPAVNGTERALTAAHRAGVDRVVLTSSTAAIVYGRGKGRPDQLGPEDWPDPDDGLLSAYALSKYRAEKRAWELASAPGAPELAVINPGFILGPLLDDDPGTSGALFQRLLRGKVPMLPNLHLHAVDVRDLARIHVAALTAPEAAGHRHLAAFHHMTLADLARMVGTAVPERQNKMPKRRAPDWLVRIIALFDGDIRANLNELGYAPRLDASRARALLDQEPRPLDFTVASMARSVMARGLA